MDLHLRSVSVPQALRVFRSGDDESVMNKTIEISVALSRRPLLRHSGGVFQ